MKIKTVKEGFKSRYDAEPTLLVRAPGRVNLIGEHTDYNLGFVLPAAIDKAVYLAFSPRVDDLISLYAVDLEEFHEAKLDNLQKSEKSWANFLMGVVHEMLKTGAKIKNGFNVAFGGDVPLGAGLSSSAAIESGMAFGMNQIYQLGYSDLQLVLFAQQAENNFVGLKCGIMDMYASVFGRSGQLIKLDCRALTHEYLPFELENHALLLINTGVKHSLADSAYNTRRQECEAGVEILQRYYPEINSLRDVKIWQLEQHRDQFSEVIFRRCSFVVSETMRMERATEALGLGDLQTFGRLMCETHQGLSKEYEVSCSELDFLANLLQNRAGVLGSRMMGGGFGGCTINLIEKEALNGVIAEATKAYYSQFGIEPETYEVKITDGCGKVETSF